MFFNPAKHCASLQTIPHYGTLLNMFNIPIDNCIYMVQYDKECDGITCPCPKKAIGTFCFFFCSVLIKSVRLIKILNHDFHSKENVLGFKQKLRKESVVSNDSAVHHNILLLPHITGTLVPNSPPIRLPSIIQIISPDK